MRNNLADRDAIDFHFTTDDGGASFRDQSRGRKVKQKEDNSSIALHSYLDIIMCGIIHENSALKL